jgi:hypothetical protein
LAGGGALWSWDKVGIGDPAHGTGDGPAAQNLQPKGNSEDGDDMQGSTAKPGVELVNSEFHGVKTLSKSRQIQPFLR